MTKDPEYVRKQKETQELIIRQACIKAACSAVTVNNLSENGIDFVSKQIIKLSENLREWVLLGVASEKEKAKV